VPIDRNKHKDFVHDVESLYGSKIEISVKAKKKAKKSGSPPTPDQLERGILGEKEMLRRLSLPGGFQGLTLLEDKRCISCGYDLLCTDGNDEIEVEVKTSAESGGQIFLTNNELRQAKGSKGRYWLVGFFDNGKSSKTWKARKLIAPFSELMREGNIEFIRQLRVNPVHLKWAD
jgi:hypothetical protein